MLLTTHDSHIMSSRLFIESDVVYDGNHHALVCNECEHVVYPEHLIGTFASKELCCKLVPPIAEHTGLLWRVMNQTFPDMIHKGEDIVMSPRSKHVSQHICGDMAFVSWSVSPGAQIPGCSGFKVDCSHCRTSYGFYVSSAMDKVNLGYVGYTFSSSDTTSVYELARTVNDMTQMTATAETEIRESDDKCDIVLSAAPPSVSVAMEKLHSDYMDNVDANTADDTAEIKFDNEFSDTEIHLCPSPGPPSTAVELSQMLSHCCIRVIGLCHRTEMEMQFEEFSDNDIILCEQHMNYFEECDDDDLLR